jgi:hypothetical protein
MDFENAARSAAAVTRNARGVARQSFKLLNNDISLIGYPLLAFWIIFITLPIVSGAVLAITSGLMDDPIFSAHEHVFRVVLSTVVITYVYSSMVMSYFTCAVASAATAQLQGQPIDLSHGLRLILRHFKHLTRFAIFAAFLPIIALVAHRHNLRKNPAGVLGSSVALSMAQIAPAVIHEQKNVRESIRISADRLGGAWREQLVLKVWLYASLIVLAAFGFLPQLLSHWFNKDTAHQVQWAASILVWLTIFIATKVIWGVATAVLYWDATTKN